MRSRQKISAIALALLLGAVVYGLIRTTEPQAVPSSQDNGKHGVPSRVPLVDQSPLKTAQQLAQLATTPEERPLAEEALRLADREVDLAFAAALRDAAENPPVLSPEAKEIEARLQKAQKLLKADQALVAQLTDAEAEATGDKKETLGDQLDLAKAELELDQDEVDDAKQDLIRAGGDPEDRIQEMVQEHEAAAHGNASAIPNTPPTPEERGLIRRFQQWSALHQKQLQLWRAKQDSEAAASALTAQHNALESRVDAAKQESPELAHRSKRAKPAESPSRQPVPLTRAPEDSAALVQITKQIASDQKALATFDKRIDTHKQLVDVYRKWIDVIAAKQRTVINDALRGILVVLAIALIALYFGTLMDKLVNRLPIARWVDGFLLIAAQGGSQFAAHREKWSLLYAGIDVLRYRPDPEARRRGVLFVGRLLPHKGINYLIEAIDPGVPLRIFGRPYHEEYLKLLHQLAEGKDVTFVTEASDDDIRREYQTAAVAVLSSVNTNVYGETTALPELLGFTAMEAMACGTPVLCSDVGALCEVMVDGVTGFLVPPNDPAALRDRIRRLLGDPALAARLGAAARQRIVERFTWDAVAERCLAAYGKERAR